MGIHSSLVYQTEVLETKELPQLNSLKTVWSTDRSTAYTIPWCMERVVVKLSKWESSFLVPQFKKSLLNPQKRFVRAVNGMPGPFSAQDLL